MSRERRDVSTLREAERLPIACASTRVFPTGLDPDQAVQLGLLGEADEMLRASPSLLQTLEECLTSCIRRLQFLHVCGRTYYSQP